MEDANRPSQRFYDLDALRAVAMFLGIVLHSGVFLVQAPHPLWPIHDPAATGDPTYTLAIEAIHGFRMPVFFLLSGFFSALLWQRRGLRSLAQLRLRRIGIPFLFGCFTIVPLSVWLLASASGYQEPYNFPIWTLPLLWIFTLGHLWFLWYLLLMTAGFIFAAWRGVQFRHPIAWWVVIPLSMALSLLMVEPIYGADNALGLFPAPATVAYYACFFVFGVFFYQRGGARRIRSWWTAALLPAPVLFYAGFSLLGQYLTAFEGAAPFAYMFKNPLTLASALIQSASAWLMCFGLMGLFRWIASRESAAALYFSDASYWTYLVHVPLVIVGQLLVVGLPIHYHLKFLTVCVGVTLVALVTYRFAVRYTIIGRTLNGPRVRRRRLPAAQPVAQG